MFSTIGCVMRVPNQVFPRCNRRLKHLSSREDARCLSDAHPDRFSRVALKEAGVTKQDLKLLMLAGVGASPDQFIPAREKRIFRAWWLDCGGFLFEYIRSVLVVQHASRLQS